MKYDFTVCPHYEHAEKLSLVFNARNPDGITQSAAYILDRDHLPIYMSVLEGAAYAGMSFDEITSITFDFGV